MGFKPGNIPWNKGISTIPWNKGVKGYKLNIKNPEQTKENIRMGVKKAWTEGKYIGVDFSKTDVQKRKMSKAKITNGNTMYRKWGKKDNCQLCKSKNNLLVHHKDFNRLNNNIKNLICICRSCHKKTHDVFNKLRGERK